MLKFSRGQHFMETFAAKNLHGFNINCLSVWQSVCELCTVDNNPTNAFVVAEDCYWLELWWLTTYLPTCPHYSRADRFRGSLTLKETCIEDWWKKPRWMCGVDVIEMRKCKWWRGREGEGGNDSTWSGELIGDSQHSFALIHIGEMLSLWVAMVTENGWVLFNVSSCTYMGEGWGQFLKEARFEEPRFLAIC